MKTFVIIKPDAIGRRLVGEILTRFERAGLQIRQMETRLKDSVWCDEQYRHIQCLGIYKYVNYFMTNTPLIGIILEGHDAVERVRFLVGQKHTPGTIRGDFDDGHRSWKNLVHASDSPGAVDHESTLFFKG